MKRSSCVSALLVSLSLTTASAAFAASPASTENPPVQQVAKAEPLAQQQDPAPSGTTAPSNAPAASGDGTASTQPAVSVGTGTTAPASDTPATSAPEPSRKPKPRPFAGSALFAQTSMTTNTVFRGQTQYDNPTVESNLFLMPRYALNKDFQLRARAILSYEYTNSDSTTYRNEPQLSDTTLQLFYRGLPKLPFDIAPSVAFNLGLPTSKLSRARTLVVAPGATLQLVRGFEHVLGGELSLISSLTYSHPLYQSRNPEVVDARPPGAFTCVGGNNCQDLLSGTMNPSDSLSYSLIASMEWGKWSPALMYLGGSQWAYHPKEALNPVDGTPVGRPAGSEPTSVRQSHYFSAWLDYNFNGWFTGEVGYQHSISALSGSSSYTNPVFSRYGDSRVYLGAGIQLDNLVKSIQGGDEGEGGIVRAKNYRHPIMRF